MVRQLFIRAAQAFLPLLCITALFVLISPVRAQGDVSGMRSYCSVPPLAGSGVKPNLLLMIDNSASMYDLAYTEPSKYCLDDSYADDARYTGYFDQDTIYSYNFPGNRFVRASDQAIPVNSSNVAGKSYVFVNFSSGSSGKVKTFRARGKFLNWLSMSKLDLEKKALTGGKLVGKTETDPGLLQGETRGCQGNRFVKIIEENSPITFVVRGPLSTESDYIYRASQGGSSRIEVYGKPYKKTDCLRAVQDWQEGGAFKADADKCAGNVPEADGKASKGMVFTEVMGLCYSSLADGKTIAVADTLALQQYCKDRLVSRYHNTASLISKNDGDAVCGGGSYHNIIKHGAFVSYSNGYLGWTYSAAGEGVEGGFGSGALGQVQDFCSGVSNPFLTDPSVTANQAGTNVNVPGFILEGGIANLGEISATMMVSVVPGAPPKGLIQDFSDDINFGAMVFNYNGAGSECSNTAGAAIPCLRHCQNAYTSHRECYQNSDCNSVDPQDPLKVSIPGVCQRDDPQTDGGRIISYLAETPAGDHGSSLAASINSNVTAYSWTPLAESFYEAIGYFAKNSDLRLTPGAFDGTSWPPSNYSCRKNNILIVTDGVSTMDRAAQVSNFVDKAWQAWGGANGMPASLRTKVGDTGGLVNQGSYNLDDLAWIARNKNFAPGSSTPTLSGNQTHDNRDFISTYVVYTGAPCPTPGGCSPDGSLDENVPEKMMQLVAYKGGGRFARAKNPGDLEGAIGNMFMMIGTGANSATDASILSTGDANGAIFLQEQFYPSKSFDGGATSASWIGEMQSLWYYIDPFIGSTGGASTIREETEGVSASDTIKDLKLDLVKDYEARFVFNAQAKKTEVRLFEDANGDGVGETPPPLSSDLRFYKYAGDPDNYTYTSVDNLKTLWRAGRTLWSRDIVTHPRKIYTQSAGTLMDFSSLDTTQPATLNLLQAGSKDEADNLISFIRGAEISGGSYRQRRLSIDGSSGVWRLGDIVGSTPRLQTSNKFNNYDLPAPAGYRDLSYGKFVASTSYQNRGMAYVGANDGMLHAFKIGKLGTAAIGHQKASLSAGSSGVLGGEEWAFIPKNALPYLKYLADPLYSHLYYVDATPSIFDASVGAPSACSATDYWDCARDAEAGTNWRSVLIGGMGLGGACRNKGTACNNDTTNCVNTPVDGVGYSSYFALDITNQSFDAATGARDAGNAPRLMWEFSHPELGYATSGPAIVRIKATNPVGGGDDLKNGRWFAVFASGPTGPINNACQFQGGSDQKLKIFVLDLNNTTGSWTPNVNYWIIDTGIENAFGGAITGGVIDVDRRSTTSRGFYQDDAVYISYVKKAADGTWTDGGVGRLLTRESLVPKENLDPTKNWAWSPVIDGVGAVVTNVSKIQDRKNHKLWLYFGTGRYFYSGDDFDSQRYLIGVQDRCYTTADTLDPQCDTSVKSGAEPEATGKGGVLGLGDLKDQSSSIAARVTEKGWYIRLDKNTIANTGAERSLSDPIAVTNGALFFTTFQPSTDLCQLGSSYLWGVKYDTGGPIPASLINGKALVQMSTGSLEGVDLGGLTGRRSGAMTGKAGGVKVISNGGLRPLKQIIHIQER
jgi:type IV pilus assembly protein PilY1